MRIVGKLLLIVSVLAASLIAALAVGYAAMETLPCRWFGSGFEGSCAYGVLWTSIGLAAAVFLLLFGFLVYRIFSAGHGSMASDSGGREE